MKKILSHLSCITFFHRLSHKRSRKCVRIVLTCFAITASIALMFLITSIGNAQSSCPDPYGDCFFATETVHTPLWHSGNTTKYVTGNEKSLAIENRNMKVVWNYEPYDEKGNKGGGNIFELYDKRTDPTMQNNLVSELVIDGPGGSPNYGGLGGLGATYMYTEYGYASSDNSGYARLISATHDEDPDGSYVLTVVFKIYKNCVDSGFYSWTNGVTNESGREFQVTKQWRVTPSGEIHLGLTTTILKDTAICEPAYNFAFSSHYGWTKGSIVRHDFSATGSSNEYGLLNPYNSELTLDLNKAVNRNRNASLRHSQRFALHGQPSGSSAVLTINEENNDGYEKSTSDGLFDFGVGHFAGDLTQATSEYGNGDGTAGDGNIMHFYGWWGMGASNRYKTVTSGETYTDSFVIRLYDGEPPSAGVPAAISGDNTRLSTASNGTQATGDSDLPSISADGQYVAFASTAANLDAADGDSLQDIFLKDSVTGNLSLISVNAEGVKGNAASSKPAISADGHYVVFSSDANNLVDGDSGYKDIFLKDTQTGNLYKIDTVLAGTNPNGNSDNPAIAMANDNLYITFTSSNSNLVLSDAGGKDDVFLKTVPMSNLGGGTIQRISETQEGIGANANSYTSSVSQDGTLVAFSSNASNLASESNFDPDIFVKSITTGNVTRVSTSSTAEANGASSGPAISGDGRYVAFYSTSSNLVADDGDIYTDVFVTDLTNGIIVRVSTSPNGEHANGNSSWAPSISSDGRFIAFRSTASNLVFDDFSVSTDLFVREMLSDLSRGVTRRYPVNQDAWPDYASQSPSISADGRYLAFSTSAKYLSAGDTNNKWDIYKAILVETTSPSISVSSPSDLIYTDTAIITVDYSDEGSGIDTAAAQVSLDGNSLTECTRYYDRISCPVSGLLDGSHNISANVADLAGNTSSVAASFTVDVP